MGIYGRTIITADPFCGETEDDAVILLQWAEQVLQTRRGTLRTRPEHGFSLGDLLLAGLTPAAIVSIPAMAQAALESGRRVASAKCVLVVTRLGGGKVAVALDITIKPSSGGPSVSFTHKVDSALADYMITGS